MNVGVLSVYMLLIMFLSANLKSRAAQKKRSPTHKNAGSPRNGTGAVSPRNRSRAASNCSESNMCQGVSLSESVDTYSTGASSLGKLKV